MRNLKRFLALALTMLMVIGSFSLSAKSFADTAEMTTEQINALDVLSDLSIFIGKEDGTFGGAEEINRKEMAILASRIQTGEKFGSSYGENVTPFADVVSDFEAILYASNMGIVIGFEDGTFRPDDKVIYQDVLTMIVRTLGYKGAEMDAGYPSTYINKARELGITKGITSTVIPSWTSNVARQDVATLLYNALFAVKADGTTAAKFFGIDTYVVTAVGEYNITGVQDWLANGTRVVVQPLNADGSINDMYYHIPVAAFTEAGLTPVHGASYRIASTDNLETVKAITACPSAQLSDDGETAELYAEGTVVIIDPATGKPVTYDAVERYTKVYNNQGTHYATNEIIVYNQRGFNWTLGTNYTYGDKLLAEENSPFTAGLLTDAYGNLLDRWGHIVAYFVPEWVSLRSVQTGVIEGEVEGTVNGTSVDTNNNNATTTINGSINGELTGIYAGVSGILYPYAVYDEATGTYSPATASDIAKAAEAQATGTRYRIWTGDNLNYWCPDHNRYEDPSQRVNHATIENSPFIITNKDDKYTAVAYDDDFDGDYDRLFFAYHTFGIGLGGDGIGVESNFNLDNSNQAAMAPYIADTTVAADELVRFYTDAAREQYNGPWLGYQRLTSTKATVVEKYETTIVSGLVTAVNGTKMTIGGVTYDKATLGLHNFAAALRYTKQNNRLFIGQNVTAVLYDGGIFEIKGNTNTWIVFEDYTGLTTNGYMTALAFSGSSELKNITIASVDGYFFLQNSYNIPTNTGVSNINPLTKLETGRFYAAQKDIYGYYHIDTKLTQSFEARGGDHHSSYYDQATGTWHFSYENNYGWSRFIDNGGGFTVRFKNGISTKNFNLMNNWNDSAIDGNGYPTNQYSQDDWMWEIKRLTATNAPNGKQWEFIIYNPETKTFTAGKGFPTDGSTLTYTQTLAVSDWLLASPQAWNEDAAMYLGNWNVIFLRGEFNGSFQSTPTTQGTISTTQTDVVWISEKAAANYSVDNVVPGLGGAGETLWGYRYIYNKNVLSLMTGEYVTVCTEGVYNYRLEPGFYSVKNGVIDMKITDLSQPGCILAVGTLQDANDDYAKVVETAGATAVSENVTYELDLVPYKIFRATLGGTNRQQIWMGGEKADGTFTYWTSRADAASALGQANDNNFRVMYVKGSPLSTTPVFVAMNTNDSCIWGGPISAYWENSFNLNNKNGRTYDADGEVIA